MNVNVYIFKAKKILDMKTVNSNKIFFIMRFVLYFFSYYSITLFLSTNCVAIESNATLQFKLDRGNTIDILGGTYKEAISTTNMILEIKNNGSKATLNTSETKLRGEIIDNIGDQITYYFKAKKSAILITCYPKLYSGFLSIHSDASDFGGARILTKYGTCNIK